MQYRLVLQLEILLLRRHCAAFRDRRIGCANEQKVAVLVMVAVMISGLVSLGIARYYIYLGAMRQTLDVSSALLIAPIAGIAGGIAGWLFSRALLGFSAARFPWSKALKGRPMRFAAALGLIVAIIAVASAGATWGTGYEATRNLIESERGSIWFGPAKFLSSIATSLSGAPGGVFAPSLAVGAGLGDLLTAIFPHDPKGAIVLLGMSGYFVGVVRAPLTAVIILIETTASRGMILPLFVSQLL